MALNYIYLHCYWPVKSTLIFKIKLDVCGLQKSFIIFCLQNNEFFIPAVLLPWQYLETGLYYQTLKGSNRVWAKEYWFLP